MIIMFVYRRAVPTSRSYNLEAVTVNSLSAASKPLGVFYRNRGATNFIIEYK
jgi:hypothetical protein